MDEAEDLELSSSSFFIPGQQNGAEESTPTRRRVRKTRQSAVVLDFNALRRCIESSPQTPVVDPVAEPLQQRLTPSEAKPDEAVDPAAEPLQQQLTPSEAEDKARLMQRWYRLLQARPPRRVQILSDRQEELVWAMVLGHRVRLLLRCESIHRVRSAIREVLLVLAEVFSGGANPATSSASRSLSTFAAIQAMRSGRERLVLAERGVVAGSDRDLASSLLRQLSQNKAKLRELVFTHSRWRQLPSPGFLDLSRSIKLNQALSNQQRAALSGKTPPRPLAASASAAAAPTLTPTQTPNATPGSAGTGGGSARRSAAAVSHAASPAPGSAGSARKADPTTTASPPLASVVSANSSVLSRTPPRSLQELLDSAESEFLTAAAARASNNGASLDFAAAATAAQAAAIPTPTPPPPPLPPPCPASRGPQRGLGSRAHIQLEVLGADRLCAARKKQVPGGGTPDRKPGLRVTLLLPPVPVAVAASGAGAGAGAGKSGVGGGGSGVAVGPLSAVKKLSRDFTTATLHPRWDTTLHVPLPVPKSLLPTPELFVPASSPAKQRTPEVEAQGEAPLLADARAYTALLDWWAGGVLRVEVVDGERFNSEIFLGQADLLLSQFLLNSSMGGTIPLAKASASDRVTGNITLHAYLHLPELSANADPLRPQLASGASLVTPSVTHSPSLGAGAGEQGEAPAQPLRIAKSVRMSQPRHKTPSPSVSVLRAVSPVRTDSPSASASASAAAAGSSATEPSSPPPPPPPPPSSRLPSAVETARRVQISQCLDGLDEVAASTDALLGLINSKMRRPAGQPRTPSS